MKKVYVFLLILLFFSFANAQTYDFPDNIFGFSRFPDFEKTKGIKTIHYVEQSGEHVFNTKTLTFDKEGRKIEEISQNAGIEVHSGQMIRLGSKTIYIYDSKGRLEKSLYFSPEGERGGTEVNKYDENNMLVEQIYYDNNGKKTSEWKYTRNPEKREVEVNGINYYDGRAVPNDKNVFVFNEQGICIKKIEYKKNGSIDSTNTFDYNAKGYISKYTKTYEGFYGYSYEYKYDLKGNWIERQTTYFEDDKKESRNHKSEYRIITYYEDTEKSSVEINQNNKSKN